MPSELKNAIQKTHNCNSTHKKDVEIVEKFNGEIVWEGVVSVFNVDHPKTDTCYAWESPIEGSTKKRYYAVLKIPPINSPQDAVRAAIVQDFRNKKF